MNVDEFRVRFREETPIRLVSTAPPTTWAMQADRSLLLEEEPGAAIGMNLSAAMIRLLGHYEGYGLQYPIRRALASYRRYCAGKHRRWLDHRAEPMCWQLATDLIVGGTSLKWTAEQHDITYPRAERMVMGALQKMTTWIERWETEAA